MKYIIIIASILFLICVLWILKSNTSAFYKQLLKQESDFRINILKQIDSLQSERIKLNDQIVNLQSGIKIHTAELKSQIQKIKLVYVPTIDYSKFTDTAIVSRLLSDYPNR
jgi:cell division protein FtsB